MVICENNINSAAILIQTDTIKQQISKIIAQMLIDWNSGELAKFMAAYAKDDETLFISGHKFIRGWQNCYDFYQQKYAANNQDMGQLRIDINAIKVLSKSCAFLYGTWHLNKDQQECRGVTSLVFKINNNNWEIILDHSN